MTGGSLSELSLRCVGPVPVWAAAALAAAFVGLAFWFGRRETAGLSRAARWGLPGLRALAFVVAALLLTGPVLHRRATVGELGRVRVVLDDSASMALRDAHAPEERKRKIAAALGLLPPASANALAEVDATPRRRRAERLLTDAPADLLATLAERHVVTLHALRGGEVVPLDLSEPGGSEPADSTDLAAGLSVAGPAAAGAAAANAGRPREAVVLLTDGRHNAGPSPLTAAKLLGDRGVPVFAVGFGADAPAADLALVDVEAPDLIFKSDILRGELTVRDRLPAGTPFTAELRAGDAVLWREDLTATGAGDRRVPFEADVSALADRLAESPDGLTREVVTLELEATVTGPADETDPENNARPLRVAAAVNRRRALLLDGRPRWELRYLRNALSRDPRWEVVTVLAEPGGGEVRRGDGPGEFPAGRDDLFGFDLVVYGEFPPAVLTDDERRWLREFVGVRGGGLVFIDGRDGVLGELPADSLRDLLPVRRVGGTAGESPTALRLTDAGAALDALRVRPDDEANRRFWAELPAPHVLFAAEALPGSEVLAEAVLPDGAGPAVVTRPFGAGRVLYLAFDETWRWRYRAADAYHQRIWNQLAGFVMPRPFAVSDDFAALDAGPPTAAAGSSAPVRVRLARPDGRPAAGVAVDAVLTRDGAVVGTVALAEDPLVPGLYRGATAGLEPGDYEVSVRAAGFAADALRATARVLVEPPTVGETADTAADFSLLEALAAASGGAAVREEDAGELPGLLERLSDGRVVETDVPLWDSWWAFAAVLIPLAVEWAWRKRAGLL